MLTANQSSSVCPSALILLSELIWKSLVNPRAAGLTKATLNQSLCLFCCLLALVQSVAKEGQVAAFHLALTIDEVLLSAEDGHLDRALDVFVAQMPQVGFSDMMLLCLNF